MAQLGDSGYPTPGRAATTPAAPTPMAMTPDGAALSGGGAAALLRGMHGVPMVMQVPEEIAEAVVSRKDKSLGLKDGKDSGKLLRALALTQCAASSSQ